MLPKAIEHFARGPCFTNEEVRRKIQAAVEEYDEFLTLAKKWKLRWFGHISRFSGLVKMVDPTEHSVRKEKKR